MSDIDGNVRGSRGQKRKLPGDEVKLTFSQRLAAAARKAPKHAEPSSDAESNGVAALSYNSSLRLADSSDVDETPETTHHLEQDDIYRNLYAREIDFAALAEKDVHFRACLINQRQLDFNDPQSVMQLTKTLLETDFGLRIELPSDRLCPPVPNRHNYILWLKELVDSSSPSYNETYEIDRKVTGLDIGTGASTIYPLLGCTQRSSWNFIATDIDAKSLSFARKNVELNDLWSRIRIVERSVEDTLIPLDDLQVSKIDFTMTNPPFYTSESELFDLAKIKGLPPNGVCTGAPNEMVCEGGEIGFFQRIFDESLVLRNRVQWYTTMLGKQSSLEVIIDKLKENNVDNFAVAEFVQGSKTRRWAVGWSFADLRPNDKACRGFEPSAGKKLLPHPTEMTVASKSTKKGSVQPVENIFWTQLEDVTDGLDLVSWNLDEGRLKVVGFADQNVWSRAYRRGKARNPILGWDPANDRSKPISECAFGFSITIKTHKDQLEGHEIVEVVVRWLQGREYSLFESFSGMLRNALLNVLS